jgi:uncharacterized circularly permuted ATP-grasp superfamily protein
MHVTQLNGEAALFGRYRLAAYDEMFDSARAPRAHYASLHESLIELGPDELERRGTKGSNESFLLTRSPG